MENPMPTLRLLLALVAAALLPSATPRGSVVAGDFQQASTGPFIDLKSSDELRARFNADSGHVRLVLLLSPT